MTHAFSTWTTRDRLAPWCYMLTIVSWIAMIQRRSIMLKEKSQKNMEVARWQYASIRWYVIRLHTTWCCKSGHAQIRWGNMPKLLGISAKEDFHSRVAKLLYLAKRTRPDILLPINFLCTRVLKPTVQDWKKLLRVYRYLFGTKGLCIYLQADDGMCAKGFYDTPYGFTAIWNRTLEHVQPWGKARYLWHHQSRLSLQSLLQKQKWSQCRIMLESSSRRMNSIFINVDEYTSHTVPR